jgi:hypothetical protein
MENLSLNLLQRQLSDISKAQYGAIQVGFHIRFPIRFKANRKDIRFSFRHENQASTHKHDFPSDSMSDSWLPETRTVVAKFPEIYDLKHNSSTIS